MTRLFTGDYSTGDFRQWTRLVNKQYEVDSTVRHPTSGNYAATIITDDVDCGYCARFEVRNGDLPPTVPGGERSEVLGDTNVFAAAGTLRWYAFSIKFDATFPTDHTTVGWDTIIQWKAASQSPYTEYGSPVLSFGWGLMDLTEFRAADTWFLVWNPQSAPGVSSSPWGQAVPILSLPLDAGKWHDIKMRAEWAKDGTGTVQAWRNGARLTFDATYGGGGETFTGQTVCGGTGPTGVAVHQGIYRQSGTGFGRTGSTGPTEILYHKGFRMADSEDTL